MTADIERMAREAGIQDPYTYHGDPDAVTPWICATEDLARFAALVRAQALEDAARMADKHSFAPHPYGMQATNPPALAMMGNQSTPAMAATASTIARAIRALATQATAAQSPQAAP